MVEGIRVNITDDGEVVISIPGGFVKLKSAACSALIGEITTAQNDAADLLKRKKEMDSIKRNYNGLGKIVPITGEEKKNETKEEDKAPEKA